MLNETFSTKRFNEYVQAVPTILWVIKEEEDREDVNAYVFNDYVQELRSEVEEGNQPLSIDTRVWYHWLKH